ncbi:hypothetical protein ACFV3R_27020 [Streptomyces sp. NPDC059740]|uniref:hypothetical protein n=1 Tax=Streptomyces sp. NPDC059740 TaxID=3346926 RepID=UPI00365AEA8D
MDAGDGDIDDRTFPGRADRLPDRRSHHCVVERDDAGEPAADPAGSPVTAQRSARYLPHLRV